MRSLRQSAVVVVVFALTLWLAGIAGPVGARAVTALIMGGTGQPHPEQVNGYVDAVGRLYIDPGSSCKVSTCTLMPTYIPNEASPIYTDGMVFGDSVEASVPLLDAAVRALLAQSEQVVLFGNSQSATVVTEEVRALSTDPGVDLSRLEVVLIGDPNRPNGGFLQRFYPFTVPIFEYTPSAAPLNEIPVTSTNIAFQFDIAANFPKYPLNLFALLNTIIGIDIHGTYTSTHGGYTEDELLAAINDPANSQIVGYTRYITIPAKELPLAEALRSVGYTTGTSAVMNPLTELLEPLLWVLVELGYDRTNPGSQQSFGLFPLVDPVRVLHDLGSALGEGIHNVLAGMGPHGAVAAVPDPQPAEALDVASRTAIGEPIRQGDQDPPEDHAAPDSPAAEPDTGPVALAGPETEDTETAGDDERVRVVHEWADHRPETTQRRRASTYDTQNRLSRGITRHSAPEGGPAEEGRTAESRRASTYATQSRLLRDITRHSPAKATQVSP